MITAKEVTLPAAEVPHATLPTAVKVTRWFVEAEVVADPHYAAGRLLTVRRNQVSVTASLHCILMFWSGIT